MKKQWICIIVAVVIGLTSVGYFQWRQDRMVENLSREVFRFHVLANSDSKEDQELKMKVKETVISYMEDSIPESLSVQQTKRWAWEHLEELERLSLNVLDEADAHYDVHAEVTRDYFPEKTYGDVTFPAGEYEALRIEIGSAKGQNWWCVLYPNLCFIDAVKAVVPKEGKEQLQQVLSEDLYDMITEPPKWKIRWFFFQK